MGHARSTRRPTAGDVALVVSTGAGTWASGSGQTAYLLTMLSGLALALLLGTQLALVAAARWSRAPRAAPTARLAHRLLGRLLLVLVVAHPLLYVAAVVRRTGAGAPRALAAPFLDGGFYGLSLWLGLVAAVTIVVLGLRQQRGTDLTAHAWIRVGLLLGLLHALRVGSHLTHGPSRAVALAAFLTLALESAVLLARSLRIARRA